MENIEKKEEELNNDTTLEKNDIKSNQNKKVIQKVFAIFTLVISVIYFLLSIWNIANSSKNIFFILTTLIAFSLIPISAILTAFTFKNKKIMPFLITTLAICSFLFLNIFIRYIFLTASGTPIGFLVISWLYKMNGLGLGALAIVLIWAQPLVFSLFIAPITLGSIAIYKECKIIKNNLK